jgi:cation/acetate symporter
MPEGKITWVVEDVGLTLTVVLALFGIYYLVSVWARLRTHETADLWVAGRKIAAPINGMAMTATWLSLATALGVVALIVKGQVPFVFLWIQWTLSIPMIIVLYGTQLRRLGSFTPASFIHDRYGSREAVLAAVIMVIILVMYALGNIIGTAKVFEALIGVPYLPALIIAGLAVTGYVAIGGMYGVSYNDALQMMVMLVTFIVPLMAIMKMLGADVWWFPSFGYADMTDSMLKVFPTYFDMKFPLKWYIALFLGFTMGAMGLPHLAIRVFTAPDVRSARYAVIWFVFFAGLMFTATYAMGFAGVYFFTQQGIEFPLRDADKTTMVLNIAFNRSWVVAFVFAGIIAAGISSVASHMIGIAALIVHDIVRVFRPDLQQRTRLRLGAVVILLAGVVATLLALRPPAFLVINIFWAFCLCASCITPQILLGTWSSRINRYGVMLSMVVCLVVYVVLSPFVIESVVVGSGLAAKFGLAAAFITVPLGFFLTIVGSLLAERVPAIAAGIPREQTQALVERMHGWQTVSGQRYSGTTWLLILAAVCVPLFIWGIMPWSS